MSTSSKMTLSLGEQQLAKLTNETPEIRMRALEQVETRFIRCLQHNETINFKPVLLLKQLIRWFGYTPPTSADRVLALMLELLRSDYGDAVIQKIPYQRLLTELEKIRKILVCLQSKRAMELLDDLQALIAVMYKENDTASDKTISSGESECSYIDVDLFSLDSFNISPNDYEPAWSRASLDDMNTLKTILDSLTVDSDEQMQENLINLQIKLCDYPVEYLLQPPYIYLQLLHEQKLAAGETLLQINRTLLTTVRQIQRRLKVRNQIQSYAKRIESQETWPKQLRISSALTLLLLNGCFELLGRPQLVHCYRNCHVIELIVEVIRTFAQLATPIPKPFLERLGLIVTKLLRYCCNFKIDHPRETAELTKKLMLPRLESLIFNGLLLDVIMLNITSDVGIDRPFARKLLHPLTLDSTYKYCVEERGDQLHSLVNLLDKDSPAEEVHLVRLSVAYSLALNQLKPDKKLPPMKLLMAQRNLCLVLTQMGSESLLLQLFQAIVQCTSFYGTKPKLRQEAESLLLTLFALPTDRLHNYALHLLRQPVVDHFHAFMNNSNYLTGCSNLELAKQHILGLPMSTELLRNLLIIGWLPQETTQPQLQLQQWCIDYLIMLIGLAKLIERTDFNDIFKMVLPVVPLIVARAIELPQLQHLLWDLLDPDAEYLGPTQALRGNVCYLFHPDANFRKDAMHRVVYVLIWQDHQQKYRPDMNVFGLELIGYDICKVQPPINYLQIFSERSTLPSMRSLQALLRLLETPDLKPSIRKSTLVQLNVLLHNWQAAEDLATLDGAYVLCLKALHDPLLRDRCGTVVDDADTLLSAIGILLRLLFRCDRFREEFKDNAELLVCLLRCIFLLPHELQFRAEISICIFQLLFHEHITSTDESLQLNVNLSPLLVPVSYEVHNNLPLTPQTEGLAIQHELYLNRFESNAAIAEQYWRLAVAQKICITPNNFKLSEVWQLDIDKSLKLKPADLSLVQASLAQQQLQNQLIEANNCSSHETLHQLICSIQLFLVLLRNDVLPEQGNSLWLLLHKYLRLRPGNTADRQLYIALLGLCHNCLRVRLPDIVAGLNNALETDPHHSFFMILRDRHVSLNLLQLVSDSLVELLSIQQPQNNFTWHKKLFVELSTLARTQFELRNLQHVRCILSILRKLSTQPLKLDATKIQAYFQHFVQLSSNLRTSTQTGAQWQRDCLLIICQLQEHTKLQRAVTTGKCDGSSKVVRYLMGLCGHGDGEVRSLAWVSIGNWIKSSPSNMACILLEFNNFLPGGLAACCLSTMQDEHEQLLVRELAGRVFELLMPHIGPTMCTKLLMDHTFLQQAHAALGTLQLQPNNERFGQQTSCEVIACYVSICVRLVILQPSWCAVLCDHAFINALSDVMKIPTPLESTCSAYVELCAGQICKLYAICYCNNFEFLQRTICRDPVLLQSFFTLINDVLVQKVVPEHQLVEMLKLLMVFCKDTNAYEYVCEKFKEHPELIFDMLGYGLDQNLLHSKVQGFSLAAISLLLIKAQKAKKEHCLLRVFEEFSKQSDDEEETDNEISNEKEKIDDVLIKQMKTLTVDPVPKPKLSTNNKKQQKQSDITVSLPAKYNNAAVLLYYSLDQLFVLLYPGKTYSFLQPVRKSRVQICEVLGNLLKQSAVVVDAAHHFKLLDRVIQLLEAFLDDGSVGNASVYVRRVGAHKSRDIINNLLVLLNMLVHWHSAPNSVISDPVMAARVVRVLVRIWPWLSHSIILKQMTVRFATLLTEHSLEMCKQTSQVMSSLSHSLLQLMVRVADHETTKKEAPSVKCAITKGNIDSTIDAALRVMINCCSCAEGRISLGKMRVLDMFDTIMPGGNSTVIKVKPHILLGWLGFWEIFSRYELGHKICHLTALLNTVRRSPPLSGIRLRCLHILRNMCFSNSNRTQLVNTTEFVDLLRDIVTQPVQSAGAGGDTNVNSYEEHHLVVLCLWKLFGFSAKCKGMLRGTKLYKQLTILWDELVAISTKRPEQFDKLPFAKELKDLLANLFESLKQ